MATKPQTTSTVTSPQLGTNRQTSPVGQQPQRPQPGTRQPNPNERPRPFSQREKPESADSEQNLKPDPEEARKYYLATDRADRPRIKNAEEYRKFFKKTFIGFWSFPTYLALIDWLASIVGVVCLILAWLGVTIAIAGVLELIEIIVSIVLLTFSAAINARIGRMQNAMQALVSEVNATEQRRAYKQSLEDYRKAYGEARQKIEGYLKKSEQSAVRTGEKSAVRAGERAAAKNAAKTTVRAGEKKFMGKLLGSTIGQLVPFVNLWPWQLRSLYKMRKHEKQVTNEGLALIDAVIYDYKLEIAESKDYSRAAEFE